MDVIINIPYNNMLLFPGPNVSWNPCFQPTLNLYSKMYILPFAGLNLLCMVAFLHYGNTSSQKPWWRHMMTPRDAFLTPCYHLLSNSWLVPQPFLSTLIFPHKRILKRQWGVALWNPDLGWGNHLASPLSASELILLNQTVLKMFPLPQV